MTALSRDGGTTIRLKKARRLKKAWPNIAASADLGWQRFLSRSTPLLCKIFETKYLGLDLVRKIFILDELFSKYIWNQWFDLNARSRYEGQVAGTTVLGHDLWRGKR